jgi:hypothetical protein
MMMLGSTRNKSGGVLQLSLTNFLFTEYARWDVDDYQISLWE